MTVSKELAKRLVDSGIVVESEKYWHLKVWQEEFEDEVQQEWILHNSKIKPSYTETVYNYGIPACNSDELLAVLPNKLLRKINEKYSLEYELHISRVVDGTYFVCYRPIFDLVVENSEYDKAIGVSSLLPEALGNLLLKLAEAGLLEVKE